MTDKPTETIRNDSSVPTETALAILAQHGMTITYGDISMTILSSDFENAQKYVAEKSAEERAAAMLSIDRALRKALPKIRSGHFGKKVSDNFYKDLMFWEALKRAGASS